MRRLAAVLASVAVAAGLAACGAGADEEPAATGVELLVTRDFGAEVIGREQVERLPAGETVMRLLQRTYDVENRYGGGFVQSIEGVAGGEDGEEVDWFYYVNGIEADKGAAATAVSAGDHVWWDRHDWSTAMRIPAVVGAYPEPFRSGIGGKRIPIRIDCASGAEALCDEVEERLRAAGIDQVAKAGVGQGSAGNVLRLVVGPWSDIAEDPQAARLAGGPERSGVFARPSEDGIALLDEKGRTVRTLTGDAGLVAATAVETQAPTWVVTGTTAEGVSAAIAALDQDVLRNRFAVALDGEEPVPLPVRPDR